MLNIFSCAFWPLTCRLWRLLFRSSDHFLIGLFAYLISSCLYILEINHLSVALIAKIFSHSAGCLFISLMISFVVQKFSCLIMSHLFIFIFIFITLGGESKKNSVKQCSLIHLEFIFVCGVIECSSFILLHVAVQFSQYHLLKRLSFLHCIFLPLLL